MQVEIFREFYRSIQFQIPCITFGFPERERLIDRVNYSALESVYNISVPIKPCIEIPFFGYLLFNSYLCPIVLPFVAVLCYSIYYFRLRRVAGIYSSKYIADVFIITLDEHRASVPGGFVREFKKLGKLRFQIWVARFQYFRIIIFRKRSQVKFSRTIYPAIIEQG